MIILREVYHDVSSREVTEEHFYLTFGKYWIKIDRAVRILKRFIRAINGFIAVLRGNAVL